jgi:FkbM family methyltransferase
VPDLLMPTSVKRRLLGFVETAFQCRIYRRLPHGLDPFVDIRRQVPGYLPKVIFDVGANAGQSATEFAAAFPQADVYCFEPVQATFQELSLATIGTPRIQCFPLAFGSKKERLQIAIQESSVDNSLLQAPLTGDAITSTSTETVEVDTLDDFCTTHQIQQIDYLKIDTEGYDLEVLKGADALLQSGRVGFIQVEAGMNYRNDKHVPLETLTTYLKERGHILFGVYSQTPEWSGECRLRYANAVFLPDRREFDRR